MQAHDPAELHGLFMEAINRADIEALLALYEPDGVVVHLDGTVLSGVPALRGMLEELLTSIKRIEGVTRKLYVAGDVALGSANWVANPGTAAEMAGTTAEVSRRQQDGTWRFVIDDPVFPGLGEKNP